MGAVRHGSLLTSVIMEATLNITCTACGHTAVYRHDSDFVRYGREYRCPVCGKATGAKFSLKCDGVVAPDEIKRAEMLREGDECYCVDADGLVEIVTVKRISWDADGREGAVEYSTGCKGVLYRGARYSGYGMYAARVHFDKDSALADLYWKIEGLRTAVSQIKSGNIKKR